MSSIFQMTMCAAAIVLAPALAAAQGKDAVREIPTTGLKINLKVGIGTATVDKPAIITSAAEIAKHKALLDAADAIQKQVDFDKEKLLFFFWGSFDLQQITPVADKPGSFTYTTRFSKSGRFTARVKLFVVPRDAEVKVTKVKK